MNMINRTKMMMGLGGLAVATLISGCVVRPYGGVDVYAPAPVVTVDVYPNYYVWDGYEYVGIVGGQYYYLGPGEVWFRCEPFRVTRFHEWESYHSDWRAHAIYNNRYRHSYLAHDDRDSHRDRGHRGHNDEN